MPYSNPNNYCSMNLFTVGHSNATTGVAGNADGYLRSRSYLNIPIFGVSRGNRQPALHCIITGPTILEDDLFEIDEEDPPVKKLRMNSKEESTYSSYFPSSFFSKTREKCSQTVEVIDLDPKSIVETVSLLDETSSVSDKENSTAQKSLTFKNKFRAPAHCRSPVKTKFKYVSNRRGDDVQYVSSYPKDSSDSPDLLSTTNAKRPIIRTISSQRKSYNSRTNRIMSLALRSPETYHSSPIIDFRSRMKYGELLGKVLKSPEMFGCSSQQILTTTSKVIDLTDDEPSTSKSESSAQKTPSAFIDLTSQCPTKTQSSTNDVINIETENFIPNGTFMPHRRIVSPVNTFSTKLKHVPCTSRDYVSNLEDEIEKFKKEFAQDEAQVNKELLTLRPLRKTFYNTLERRLRRHLKISTIDLVSEEDEEKEPTKPILTNQMNSTVMNAWDPKKPKGQVLVNNFNYQIKRADLQTLSGLNWLNDEVINFYMELITARGKEKDFPSVHTFSTFFYLKLEKDGYTSLRRWTRKVDIFSFDLIVVPIHLSVHWCLAVIDLKKKTITYFDSMGHANNTCVNSLLRYLSDEHVDKKKEPFDTTGWELICTKDSVPQQMNSCDCGVFACTFAEYASRSSKYSFSQEDMPYFRRKMTYEILNSQLLSWN